VITMGDYYAGQLTIGGKISGSKPVLDVGTQVDALFAALSDAGSLDYGEESFEPKTKQEVLDALNDSGHLVIRNEETRGGEFADVENALTEAGMAWERWSSGYCEYLRCQNWSLSFESVSLV